MMKRILTLAVALTVTASAAFAQIKLGDGQLSGSFETNTIGYVNDSGIDTPAPDDHFGSNNYLKAEYTYGRFSTGIQAEGYLPALQGFEVGQLPDQKKFSIANKFIRWQDKNWSVMVGDIFDQYGNGLILRTFEDRQLGINNSIEGVRVSYNLGNYLRAKALYGRPRLYTNYADSWIRGGDLSFSLSEALGWKNGMLDLEASYINRYDNSETADMMDLSPNVNLVSARLNLSYKGFSMRSEYVSKGQDLSSEIADGQSAYLELNYSKGGFSASATVRMLDHMATKATLDGLGSGNTINYLPALTRQYTYMLAGLEPYQVNADGELSGQVDLYYSHRNKNDRTKRWLFHANFSTAYTLRASQSSSGKRELLQRDLNADIERQWNRSWTTKLLYTYQEWNPDHGAQHRTFVTHTFIADATHKLNNKKSLHFVAEYLYSNDYQGDWIAGFFEFNMAPNWSFFIQDMYNLEATQHNDFKKRNYFNGGLSYTYGRTRVQLTYGRNREGFVCSGGVCRFSPAYSGVGLSLTSAF